jgi:hypothetical protein
MTQLKIRSAHKDYNARGRCREHWFRFAWINGRWTYDWADGRLGSVGMRAADRHDTTYGAVEPGTVIAQHDRGGKIDVMYVVVAKAPIDGDPLEAPGVVINVPFVRKAGKLVADVPFVGRVEYPDPRR